MKTSLLILTLLSLIVLSACSFGMSASNKELDKLADEYDGVYVFDKKLREEIIELQKEELVERKKVSLDDPDFVKKMTALEEKYSILSNGCKYFLEGFNFDDVPEYAYYENKIKEYMGEQNYYTLRPYLGITSYYECGEKKYPLTFAAMIDYPVKKYGLFGDEAAGFRLSQWVYKKAGSKNKHRYFYYLINGKFMKSDEKAIGGFR